jgi:hypothetical protein
MAITIFIQVKANETWQDVISAFMTSCKEEKHGQIADVHEGGYCITTPDGTRFLPICLPEQSRELTEHLKEWAREQIRLSGYREHVICGSQTDIQSI